MGDLVIGLAKSVVQGALTKVQSAIEEETNLPLRSHRDLVFIMGEFEMMQSFLNVANEERVKNIVVRTWVRQMRELAYDLEDLIAFVVHMERTSSWSRVLQLCMALPPGPLDMAADEIEQLKARVEDVSRRNSRYSLIGDSGSKPVPAQQQLTPRAAVGYDTRRQHILGDLTQLITKNDDADLQVISVWGAGGGIGTTSIIRQSYSDPEVSHNFTCRAWVNLTHPFNPHQFVRSLMAHFYANSCQERQGAIIGIDVLTSMDVSAKQGDLLSEFVQLVDKNKYLVVLEDLSTMAEWDSIRTFLPDRKNGSWIIVSSLQYEIASLCVGHPYQVFDLKQLPAEHSVCAFLREYDLSHNQWNGHPSYHRIPNSKKKAARDWMQNSPLIGCRLKMNQLRYYTAQAQMNHSQVMSVWGMPGVGKSALVRNLYYDRILENQQFQEYGWVSLSQTQPFSLRDFSRNLLLDFQSESLQAKETAPSRSMVGMKDAVQKCSELLSTRRCLVIIDGLQSTQEWDLIQSSIVSRHSRSQTVIIVITTEASVATYCGDKEDLVLNVKALEADAAFDLLKNEVYTKDTPCPASLSYHGNAVLQDLISMCGGLPLIIVAMASILATNVVGWMDTASSINLRFMRELETNPEFESLWDLFTWMHSSFRTCPDSVKPCMFSLSFFPRDRNIRRRRLVRRWIAEGYSRDSDDKSAEENGEEFFFILLNLSIIQQPPQSDTTAFSDVRMVLCQVNGFLRECILSWGMEDNLVFELTGTCSLTTQRSGRHLVISDSWDRDKVVFESIDFSRLRSMTVFGYWKSFFVSESMKLLRVLDLEDAAGVTDDDVEQMVKLLRRLMFLSLRGCHGIFRLPPSLGHLKQLQTLDVTNTSIIILPASIARLQKLQYIRGGITAVAAEDPSAAHTSISWLSKFHRGRHAHTGVLVPRGIEKLTALHTLGVVNISASHGEELKKLTQLRKLGVCGINRKNSKAFSSAISSQYHLGSLSVWFDKESQGCLDDSDLCLVGLQSLKLYGLIDRLPGLQVNNLSKLAKLHLEMATLRHEVLEFLGKLPKLCILRLRVEGLEDGLLHFHVFTDGLEESSYQKLRVLNIACRSSLHVTFASETMKKLELLKVDCCSGSSYQLSGLDHLSELREVCLNGSYEETLKHFLQVQLADHPRKPELKLEEQMPRWST
ncbi:disease resistance protein Pik-2-like [Lolium rigidum]|uniref:disease resistance protein Pik-2-like n=1 Tax=Lolium rigidum TaxID=89674 RepID=UPI001F5CAA83|nr:disease resistance protein Pik-2-like [Lolium rigidum]